MCSSETRAPTGYSRTEAIGESAIEAIGVANSKYGLSSKST